jgi:hypothetical protein
MLTYTNDECKHTITIFRNGDKKTHAFHDHWLSLHDMEENRRGMIYYVMAHNYGTGEETFVSLTKQEFKILEREINCGDEASNFKKSLAAFNKLFQEKQRINDENLLASLEFVSDFEE